MIRGELYNSEAFIYIFNFFENRSPIFIVQF
jgi:hypothetical protein